MLGLRFGRVQQRERLFLVHDNPKTLLSYVKEG
jgi:hypothetical protein